MALKRIQLSNPIDENYHYKEAIKTLRTNIMFSGKDNKVILFTSTFAGEGKSSISFSLAVEMSKMKKRVLLIDADIRKSAFASTHAVNKDVVGLSEYLSGQTAGVEEIVYQTNYDKMHVIFSGVAVSNPVELLGDSQFARLIKALKGVYDYIFIDCPPMGMLVDSAVIGQHCDSAVIIVEAGVVSYKDVQRVKKKLENSGCHFLGTVLNKVDIKNEYYGRYGKYGRYEKYQK